MMIVKRGDIFYADLSSDLDLKHRNIRPVVIIQNNTANKYMHTVIVAPITSRINLPKLQTHVEISSDEYNLSKNSVILLEQIKTLNKERLKEKIAHIFEKDMRKVNEALIISQGLLDINEKTKALEKNIDEYKKIKALEKSIDEYEKIKALEKSIDKYEKQIKEYEEQIKGYEEQLVRSSQEKFYKFNDVIPQEEDWEYEFKEFNNKYKDESTVHDLVLKKLPEYACSVLNSEKNCDGKILFGISDKRIVKGINLNVEEKDDIRKTFYDSLDKIVPKIVDKSAFDIQFIRVKNNNKIKENFYVIECTIPHSVDSEVLYFNGRNLHIRLNGRKETIKGNDVERIQKIIRRRIYTNLEKKLKKR